MNKPLRPPIDTTQTYEQSSTSLPYKNDQLEQNNSPSLNPLLTKKPIYKINPDLLPRPSEFEDIYHNKDNNTNSIYETNISTHPPHSTSIYTVNETQNSSCRFIRSSLTKLPLTQSILSSSNLIFGLYCQPFAELQYNEDEIPKVDCKDIILRCKTCNSYINSNYSISYSKYDKRVAICNLCLSENELNSTYPGVKQDYYLSNCESPELKKPTIDFLVPESQMHTNPFIPHYLIMIDISSLSYNIGLPNYIFNSILTNIPSTHHVDNSFIGFATYDNTGVQFYSLDKNNELICVLMNDINSPFSPMAINQLSFHMVIERARIDILIEKINLYLVERRKIVTNESNITASAICAGICALEENGGRVLIFTCSPCLTGFGSTKIREDKHLFNTENEKNLYIPQHSDFSPIIERACSNRIAVDQFIFGAPLYDLGTMSTLSNLTGGNIKYYNVNLKGDQSLLPFFEKMHFDINRILSRANYYDIKAVLRFSLGVECMEILGPFNKKLSNSFQLPACDPDYCFSYGLRLSENLTHNQVIHFQLVIMYIDNFNKRYLRMFNYSLKASSGIDQIYSFCDIDTLTKIYFMKEITYRYYSTNQDIEDNFIKKIVNLFYYYKKETNKSNILELSLPGQVKYFPAFVNSFFKLGLFKQKKIGSVHSSSFIYLIHSIMRDPIYMTLLLLYPKMYRIDDIDSNPNPQKIRLSYEMLDLDRAYLSNNGETINLFVFNLVQGNQFYKDLFNMNNWMECYTNGIIDLDEKNLSGNYGQALASFIDLKRAESFGWYLPIKVYFLNNSNFKGCQELTKIIVEDKTNEDIAYADFLFYLHELITKNFK